MFRQPSIEELAAEIAFHTGEEVIIEEVVEEEVIVMDDYDDDWEESWEYSDDEY